MRFGMLGLVFVLAASSVACSNSDNAAGSTRVCVEGKSCVGAAAPGWQLLDFQPMSSRVGMRYGMEAFAGHVTVVALLSGWCPFCQQQAVKMQALQKELQAENKTVNFIAVNSIDAALAGDQQKLIDRCSFPLFQDTEETRAYDQMGGKKDDLYVYSSTGSLAAWLPYGGKLSNDLDTIAGYANLKQAILAAP